MLTTLTALFPTKTRIPNPYDLTDNPIILLRDGYGLKLDDEAPARSEFCNFSRNKIFTIVLAREVLKGDMQTTQFDTAVKAMQEDVYELQKDLLNVDQIGIESSIEKIDMGGTSGIVSFIGERSNFIAMEIMFFIQITDNL
jgi:hypothetical protein